MGFSETAAVEKSLQLYASLFYYQAAMLPKISTNKLAIFLFCFCLRENIEVSRRLVAVRMAHYTCSRKQRFFVSLVLSEYCSVLQKLECFIKIGAHIRDKRVP